MLKDLPSELINKVFYLSFEHPCSKLIKKAFHEDVEEVYVKHLRRTEFRYNNKVINQIAGYHRRQIDEAFTRDDDNNTFDEIAVDHWGWYVRNQLWWWKQKLEERDNE